ncbi:FAR1-related sequence 2 [Striga asiatica]|uniref:Protein FAR1-RELATED SEQUENCE n=1 Tax=Striga asiatica TaxID=4170 RepID=A0A5A7Q2U0_STRAF|nr:FAR1-related sequence 2 [Striga asiatica]
MEGGENEPLLEINPSVPIIPNQDHETTSSAIVMEGGENEPLLEINPSVPIIPNRDHETTSSAIVMKGGENEPLLEIENVNTYCSTNIEIQVEFVGKVYCDVISSSEGCFGTIYEVREDLFCGYLRKKKSFFISFNREKCEVVCSCHMFEFRGILCRHSIVVLIRNDVFRLPDQYILHRWRRDVRRPYTRIALKYDGLRNSPGQLRYDNLCTAFAKVADLAAEDEV